MEGIARQIREAVEQASAPLAALSNQQAAARPAPDKWSKKETLGHLIDSAANNHQRFVRACYGAAMAFPPYSQNDWVRIQHYQESDWSTLVSLWSAYNHHLAGIIERIPRDALSAQCNAGTQGVVTLEFVITDYLRHLRHHLEQLLG